MLGRPKGLLCFLPRRLMHSVPSRGEALSRFGGEDSGPRNLVPARRKDTRYTGCRGATLPVTTPASSSPLPARAVLGRSAGAPPLPNRSSEGHREAAIPSETLSYPSLIPLPRLRGVQDFTVYKGPECHLVSATQQPSCVSVEVAGGGGEGDVTVAFHAEDRGQIGGTTEPGTDQCAAKGPSRCPQSHPYTL